MVISSTVAFYYNGPNDQAQSQTVARNRVARIALAKLRPFLYSAAMSDILVVIPTYNEAENIRLIAAAVFAACPQANILFVDDNSPDGTGRLADALGQADPRVHVLHKQDKQGLGRAYIAGFKWALERHYRYIFEMDADFSHNPVELPKFIAAAANADLILGSRYINGIRIVNWPLNRLI